VKNHNRGLCQRGELFAPATSEQVSRNAPRTSGHVAKESGSSLSILGITCVLHLQRPTAIIGKVITVPAYVEEL
jgi:hypothetical protein